MLINAEGGFSAIYHEVEPAYIGLGFFEIAKDRIVDFEFSMLGFTWDEHDTGPCECMTFSGALAGIVIPFSDAQGGGVLQWDFIHGAFSIQFGAGTVGFIGNSENGTASGAFSDFEHSITVAEPGTALLLGLALILSSRFMRR